MAKFFYNRMCDLDLGLMVLDCKLVQDILTLNICMKLWQNLSINEGPRMMTKFFLKNSHCDRDL